MFNPDNVSNPENNKPAEIAEFFMQSVERLAAHIKNRHPLSGIAHRPGLLSEASEGDEESAE